MGKTCLIILFVYFVGYAQLALPGLTQQEMGAKPPTTEYIRVPSQQGKLEFVQTESLQVKQKKPYEPLFPQEGPISPDDYILGPGDRLRLVIWSGVNFDDELIITPSGEVFVADCGSIYLAGLSLSAARERVKEFIYKVYRGVKFDLFLVAMRTFRVSIIGEVEFQGLYELNPIQRLSDLVAMGKPKDIADLSNIMVICNEETTSYNLYDYLNFGRKESNPHLRDGAVVYVPRYEPVGKKAYILSPTLPEGYYRIDRETSIAEFIAQYGGFSRKIDFHRVGVVRDGVLKMLDLTEPNDRGFIVQNGDTIVLRSLVDSVYVAGEVNNPGAYSYSPGLTVAEYVGMAGGVKELGSYRKIRVIRYGKGYKPEEIEYIQPGDVIFVGRSFYALFKDIMTTTSGVLSIVLTAYALGLFH